MGKEATKMEKDFAVVKSRVEDLRAGQLQHSTKLDEIQQSISQMNTNISAALSSHTSRLNGNDKAIGSLQDSMTDEQKAREFADWKIIGVGAAAVLGLIGAIFAIISK